MKRIAAVILSVAVLASCASAGVNFSPEKANAITNGMTRERVIEVMGSKPYMVANGGKRFIWSYAKVGFMGGTESRSVRIDFDDEGKAINIPAGGVFGDSLKYQK